MKSLSGRLRAQRATEDPWLMAILPYGHIYPHVAPPWPPASTAIPTWPVNSGGWPVAVSIRTETWGIDSPLRRGRLLRGGPILRPGAVGVTPEQRELLARLGNGRQLASQTPEAPTALRAPEKDLPDLTAVSRQRPLF